MGEKINFLLPFAIRYLLLSFSIDEAFTYL